MPKKKFVTILHAPVEGELKSLTVKNDLKMFQTLVGGLVQPVPMRMTRKEWRNWGKQAEQLGIPNIKNPLIVVNEEGLLKQLPPNPYFREYVGDVFLIDDKDFD